MNFKVQEFYMLKWEYVQCSDAYRHFCEEWPEDRVQQDYDTPAMRDFEALYGTSVVLMAEYRGKYGDIRDITYDEWLQTQLEGSRDAAGSPAVHTIDKDRYFIHSTTRLFLEILSTFKSNERISLQDYLTIKNMIAEFYKDCSRYVDDLSPNKLIDVKCKKHLYLSVDVTRTNENIYRDIGKLKSKLYKIKAENRIRIDELRRYLEIYRKRENNGQREKQWQLVHKEIYPNKEWSENNRIALRSEYAKARQIIKNVIERDEFPGSY